MFLFIANDVSMYDNWRVRRSHTSVCEFLLTPIKEKQEKQNIFVRKLFVIYFFSSLVLSFFNNSAPPPIFLVRPCKRSMQYDDFGVRKKSLDIFHAMGSMYCAVLFIGVQNAASVQPVVAVERTVFYRERAAGMYSALPYAFGQV